MKERCPRCVESRARCVLEMMDLRKGGGEAILGSSSEEHRLSCFECSIHKCGVNKRSVFTTI